VAEPGVGVGNQDGGRAVTAATGLAEPIPTPRDHGHDREMTTARDIMHQGAECIPEHETLDRAAQLMREHNIGSLPICGSDDRLTGMITDRDIVVKCIAAGLDPASVTAGQIAQGTPVWVDAGADEDEVLELMQAHLIRRLPVLDDHELIGMITEADLATHISPEKVAAYCSTVYSAPATIVRR
jgi:CBS domain-containing protein